MFLAIPSVSSASFIRSLPRVFLPSAAPFSLSLSSDSQQRPPASFPLSASFSQLIRTLLECMGACRLQLSRGLDASSPLNPNYHNEWAHQIPFFSNASPWSCFLSLILRLQSRTKTQAIQYIIRVTVSIRLSQSDSERHCMQERSQREISD